MGYIRRKCDNCKKEYKADTRNLKRGWGLCCSKSCAAQKRERNKPGYDPKKVRENNYRRENWNNPMSPYNMEKRTKRGRALDDYYFDIL